MAIPPRRWVGYALLAASLSLLFDTVTFLQTNWSPLKVPMYAANELAIGCLLTVAGVLVLLAPTLKRTLLRIRIGVALGKKDRGLATCTVTVGTLAVKSESVNID
jgi:hypothetical protein